MAKTMLTAQETLSMPLKKTLIIGASGYIGGKLFNLYQQQYADLIGTSFTQKNEQFCYFELGKSRLADLMIMGEQYHSIIISAALTNIAYINDHSESSYQINVTATLALIKEASTLGLHVIYLSSDNVFSGEQGQYRDDSHTEPVSEYGRQKREVEQSIAQLCDKYTIVRLAKVVGSVRGDHTILDDIYQQLLSRNEVLAADDLIFNPTAIDDIVKVMPFIQQQGLYGTYNFCNTQSWHRYDLSIALAKRLALPVDKIKKIKFAELDNSGKRPLNTTMINSSCFAQFPFESITSCINKFAVNLSN